MQNYKKRELIDNGGSDSPEVSKPSSRFSWIKLHQHILLQEFIGLPANKSNMTGNNLRISLFLLCRLKSGNVVWGSQEEMAKTLHISPQAMSKALLDLEAMEFIVRIGGRGTTRKIMVNPNFASIGSTEDQYRLRRIFVENHERRGRERSEQGKIKHWPKAKAVIK